MKARGTCARDGWCWSARSAWLLALPWVLLWFGATTWPLEAQQPAESPPRSESSMPESTQALQLLQQADPLLTKVIGLLLDKENEIKSLRASLRSLSDQMQSDSNSRQRQYEDLLSKLTTSEMERAKLLTLLAALKHSYEEQSQYLEAIRSQATVVIGDYELMLRSERAKALGWKIGGITVGLGLAALGGYEIGHLFHWW